MDNLNDNALLDMAKYAEQMERYEDMVTYIKAYTLRKKKLDSDERNLLSVAFKNVVGARRSAWRTISNIEQKAEDVALPRKYKEAIEAELLEKCSEVLSLADECLLPNCDLVDETVFYCKMKGDYYRYLAEIKPIGTPERDEYKDSSESSYNSAIDSAKELSTTNPIRLGLSLNVSVFYYEIMSNPVKACKLAKEAFDAAIAELDNLKEDSYKDSTLIMQLLRDNLTLWTSESMNVNDNSEEDNN